MIVAELMDAGSATGRAQVVVRRWPELVEGVSQSAAAIRVAERLAEYGFDDGPERRRNGLRRSPNDGGTPSVTEGSPARGGVGLGFAEASE